MATALIPIRKLRIDSTFATTASRTSMLPWGLQKVAKFVLLPLALKQIVVELSGESMARLSRKEAEDLYGPLLQLQLETKSVLALIEQRPAWRRWTVRWWTAKVTREVETVDDILESLAWAVDPELRTMVDQALLEIDGVIR